MHITNGVAVLEADIVKILAEIDRTRFRAINLTSECLKSSIYTFSESQEEKLEDLVSREKFDDAEMLAGDIKKMLKDNKYLTIPVDIQKIEGLAELLGKTNTTDKAAKK